MNNELFKKVVDLVFNKGTYENTWIDGNENGIKCIDLKGVRTLHSIVDYSVQTIALYLYRGELVLAIHGYFLSDYYQDCVTYYSDNMTDVPLLFGDDTLEELYGIVSNIDMKSESWNYHNVK